MRTVSDYFGSLVFDDRVMRAKLPSDVYASLKRTIDEGASLDAQIIRYCMHLCTPFS